MRALVWHGRRDVRLEDVPDPGPPGPGEILVDVEWCGICGTDLEEYTDGPLVIPSDPHPLTGRQAPMVIGHEVSARVAAAGDGVTLPVGTLVALDGFLYCSTCHACTRHQVHLCERWAHIGMSYPGGLAESMVVPAAMAVPAPSDIASDELALAEPFSVAVRAVRRSRLALGDRVAVVGSGTIGLAVLQVALASGCESAVVVDPHEWRRSIAQRLGAAESYPDVATAAAASAGRYDVVFECSGNPDVPDAVLSLPIAGGRIVLVGIAPDPGTLDFKSVVLRELSLVGTIGHVYDEDMRTAVALLSSGRVDAASLITHRVPLERGVEDGIEFLAGSGRATALKILVSPRLATEVEGVG